ncbi:MAG: hypothetical protein HOE92_06285 [Euryarchaeota archaeon]|jgi:hypothetical protein|nr:hypothetical protein [Euryarchaeota archaeon]MBT4407491.1 hypothetical protein [Euryarchaeota archaeon]
MLGETLLNGATHLRLTGGGGFVGGRGRLVGLILGLLVFTLLAPLANAAGAGSLAFELNSVSLEGNGDVGVGSVWVNLTVSEVGGDSADGVLNLSLQTPEGIAVFEVDEVINLTNDSSVIVSREISNLPVGVYSLNLSLSGDISSSPSSGWSVSENFYVMRLRPLSVGLADPNQWADIAFDSNGSETGASVRDGDELRVMVPVVNLGDVNATVSFSAWEGSNVYNDSTFPILADSTYLVEVPVGVVHEGMIFFNASINVSGDTDGLDNNAAYSLVIAPPPLPLLSIEISSDDAAAAEIGSAANFFLNASNSGEDDWSGDIVCTLPTNQTEVYSSTLSIQVGQVWQHSLNVSASPGNLSCSLLNGGRISTSSTSAVTYFFDMEAAEFGMAGGGGLVLQGGPWHVGDLLRVSVLVHNSGDQSGSASLVFGSSASGVGQPVSIEAGASAELFVEYVLADSSSTNISWHVESLDGLVSTDLGGVRTLDISPSQSLSLSIEAVAWDVDEGVSFIWSSQLSSGKSREVGVELGVVVDGSEEIRQSYSLNLESGMRQITSQVGDLQSQGEVFVRLSPINWQNSGDTIATAAIPSARPELSLSLNEVPSPPRPDESTSAVVTCNLINDGGAASSAGVLRLLNSNGVLLAEMETEPIAKESSISQELTVESWPGKTVVDMTCMWTVGSEIISSDQSYLSGSMLVDDSESFEIPWFDIGIGLVVAIVIAIISRLVYTWKQEGDVDSSAGKLKVTRHAKGHSSGTSASLDEGKLSVKNREVECSACSQRLSVPETFGGTARCPACKHQFPVTALIEAPAPKTTPDPSPASQADSADSKELPNSKGRGPVATNSDEGDNDAVVSSTEDILSCPSCDSKLRVPLEKRPARARCPACKKEFMAIIG